MRLTVIGSGPAAPQADTPASGLLVEDGDTRVLLDCGLGVAGALRRLLDPTTLTAVVIGHMHADHYIDLAGLRYLFPWGERANPRLPVFLPPGGAVRLEALARAISERVGYFDDAYEVVEYSDGQDIGIGSLGMTFVGSRHYVPAWSVVLTSRAGGRLVYGGDTGPNERLAEIARGADLLICEATLDDAADDTPDRGHLSLAEAVELGRSAAVPRLLVTHYPSERRASMQREVRHLVGRPQVSLAEPSLTMFIGDPDGRHAAVPRRSDRGGREVTAAGDGVQTSSHVSGDPAGR